jgi:hypothetical protein
MANYHYERLSGQDSTVLIFEGPNTHMHVAGVTVGAKASAGRRWSRWVAPGGARAGAIGGSTVGSPRWVRIWPFDTPAAPATQGSRPACATDATQLHLAAAQKAEEQVEHGRLVRQRALRPGTPAELFVDALEERPDAPRRRRPTFSLVRMHEAHRC